MQSRTHLAAHAGAARDDSLTPALVLTLVAGSGGVLAVAFSAEIEELTIQPLSALLVGCAVLLGALIRRAAHAGGVSISFLLFVVLCLFHLGLYLQPALTGQMPSGLGSTVYETYWYNRSVLARSGLVVLVGLFAYATSVGVGFILRRCRRTSATTAEVDNARYESGWTATALADVGTAILVAGVFAWYAVSIAALGPGFALGNYLGYLGATKGDPLPLAYLAISVGTVLAAVRVRRGVGLVAVLVFCCFAIPAFVIGLRGQVLIPAVAAIPVLFRDPRNRSLVNLIQRRPARLALTAAVVGLLTVISLVQQLRLTGLQSVSQAPTQKISAFAGIQELGYSIRVVATSINWHEDLHQSYAGGATYLAPLLRPLQRLLGLPRLDADNDYGLMNVEIADRVGQIGGSMIGEAHHNFGLAGVAMVLALVGGITVAIDRPKTQALRTAWLGIAGLLTLMHVRNSFAPMIAWALASILAMGAAQILNKVHQTRKGSSGRDGFP